MPTESKIIRIARIASIIRLRRRRIKPRLGRGFARGEGRARHDRIFRPRCGRREIAIRECWGPEAAVERVRAAAEETAKGH